ncbi:hypothetical protein [Halorubrum sp. BOL3-1]|uniref:hypothetical protein n=1 Tax=Halorubrum sp. BOL3-1 TaxID=2497325 RepID=UPI001F4F62FB|nr:hypothetical protein [Halorubrum sp. BOL3-1]
MSPAATVGVLELRLFGAAYVVGSRTLGGYLADRTAADRKCSWAADSDAAVESAIERLRYRYVEGELFDAEFERRLDRPVAADDDYNRLEPDSRSERSDPPVRERER